MQIHNSWYNKMNEIVTHKKYYFSMHDHNEIVANKTNSLS